jgi:uncharacterized protein
VKFPTRRLLAALTGVLLLAGAACSSDNSDSGNGNEETTPSSEPDTSVPEPSGLESSDAQVQTAIIGDSPSATPTDTVAVENYLTAVVQDVDRVYTDYFTSLGYQEPLVGFEIIQPDETYTSNCTNADGTNVVSATDYPNAYYCNHDQNSFQEPGMIVLPAVTFGNMWSGNIFGQTVADPTAAGDFAAAYLVAHEFGHHVQAELTAQTNVEGPENPNGELLPDCLAGVYADTLFQSDSLEDGDIPEALEAASTIGDFDVNSPAHHGTPQQRVDAFWVGWAGYDDETLEDDGYPSLCFEQYWPEFYASGNPM